MPPQGVDEADQQDDEAGAQARASNHGEGLEGRQRASAQQGHPCGRHWRPAQDQISHQPAEPHAIGSVGDCQVASQKRRQPPGSLLHQLQGEGKEQEPGEPQSRLFPSHLCALLASHLSLSLYLGLQPREEGPMKRVHSPPCPPHPPLFPPWRTPSSSLPVRSHACPLDRSLNPLRRSRLLSSPRP